MRRVSILFSVFAFCAAGLVAQNADLAQYQTWMKAGAAANGALNAAVKANDAAAIKEQSAKVAESFDAIAKYWAAKGKADAQKFSEDARDAAKAVGAGDATAVAKIGATCRGCHTTYRNGSDFK